MAAEDPRVVWCPRDAAGYDTLLPTGTAIGTGRANTQVIIAACGASTAAGVAAGYRGGGKADWFLPSKDELYVLYQQRAVVGGFAGDYFWSSSQSSNPVGTAWYQGFGRGNQSIPYKVGEYRVRPVRAFG